jgi:hypothetical protein
MSNASGDRDREDGGTSAPGTPRAGGHPAASSSASPGASPATATAAGAAIGDSELLASIERLKTEQNALRSERKRVAKELKTMEKKKSRLKKRARQLSDADLLQVLMMRSALTPQKEIAAEAGANADGAAAGGAAARDNGESRGSD